MHNPKAAAIILAAILNGNESSIEKASTIACDVVLCEPAVLIQISLDSLRELALQPSMLPLWSLVSGSREAAMLAALSSERVLSAQSAVGYVEAMTTAAETTTTTTANMRQVTSLVRQILVGLPALDATACSKTKIAELYLRFASATVRSIQIVLWSPCTVKLARDALFDYGNIKGGGGGVDDVIFTAHSILASIAIGAVLLSDSQYELDTILSLLIGANNNMPWALHLKDAALAVSTELNIHHSHTSCLR